MGTSATATRSKACHWRPPTVTPTPLPHPLYPSRAPPCPPQLPTREGPLFPHQCHWVGQFCPRTAVHCWSPWEQYRTPGCPGWRATTPPCFSPHTCTAGLYFRPCLRRLCSGHIAGNTVSGQKPFYTTPTVPPFWFLPPVR